MLYLSLKEKWSKIKSNTRKQAKTQLIHFLLNWKNNSTVDYKYIIAKVLGLIVMKKPFVPWFFPYYLTKCTLRISHKKSLSHSFSVVTQIFHTKLIKNVILSLKINGLLQKHFYLKNICHTWLILITSGWDVLTENLWKHWSSHAGSWQGRSFLFTHLRCHLCFISCAISFKAFTLKHMA